MKWEGGRDEDSQRSGDEKWGSYRRGMERGRIDDGSGRWENGEGEEKWEKDRWGSLEGGMGNGLGDGIVIEGGVGSR